MRAIDIMHLNSCGGEPVEGDPILKKGPSFYLSAALPLRSHDTVWLYKQGRTEQFHSTATVDKWLGDLKDGAKSIAEGLALSANSFERVCMSESESNLVPSRRGNRREGISPDKS